MTSDASSLLPGELDARQLGRLLGCTDRTIRDLRERGIIAAGSRPGRFPAAAAVRAAVTHYREVAAGRRTENGGGGLDLVAERARLAAAQADRTELDLSVKRAELVDATAVKLAFSSMVTAAVSRLRSVPSKSKARIPTLTVRDIEVLEALIDEALAEVADGPE